MEFKFDTNQKFQTHAIEAVVDLFEGQPRIEPELFFGTTSSYAAIANELDITEETVIANLQAVQERNGHPKDSELAFLDETIETVDGSMSVHFANFSVEMETGTGMMLASTIVPSRPLCLHVLHTRIAQVVELRTALELFRRYGMRKFIVVVPSVAVREGVLKTLKITESHFKTIHGNPPYRYYVYDSENRIQVRHFAQSDGIEIMIMTIAAFNKASNVIRQATDKLQGETPLYMVQAARPILILDEPQNMESEKSVAALALLNPLFALRYSATHRNPYNLVYRLTPYDAYREGIVKRITVASVLRENEANQAFMRLDKIESKKTTITARIAVHKLMKNGTVKEQVVLVRPSDSLEAKTQRPEYADFVIEEINPGLGTVLFTNGNELSTGESQGADKEALFEAQIRYTIGQHFRRQATLKAQGIKVLSLFFIDRVANYRTEQDDVGVLQRIFDQAFEDLKGSSPSWAADWKDFKPEQVQGAYFAQKRKRGGEPLF